MRACNAATDSENTIHADDAARQFGFRGGLVPGVTVFGYMVKPLVEHYGLTWFERGVTDVKFEQPVFDGDELLIRAEGESPVHVWAERENGPVCARAEASLAGCERPAVEDYPEQPLPLDTDRPPASHHVFTPGRMLGTLKTTIDSFQSHIFASLDETNPIYSGSKAIVHPAVVMELANRVLMRNFRLGPWLHASSAIVNWGAARVGEEIQTRARVAACFERKGHEFVVLNIVMLSAESLVQQVRHTAIYRPRFVDPNNAKV